MRSIPNAVGTRHAVVTRRGAILPLIAIMLPVILIFASFCVNLSYMELARTELRIASDSAARAAGRTLLSTGDPAQTRAAAREAGDRNHVAGVPLQLADKDFVFGEATRTNLGSRYKFNAGGSKNNAVQITARRTSGSMDGVVKMVFPTFGGPNSFSPTQVTTSSQVELDIALVLDRSGSMAYGDFEDSVARATKGLGPAIAPKGWWFCDPAPVGCRWFDLVDAVQVFIDELNKSPQDEFMSLITYNSSSKEEVNLTDNYALILKAMDKHSKKMCAGATNIHKGISKSINTLSDPAHSRIFAAKVAIVLTDGMHNTGSKPESIAKKAFKDGVMVFTVTFSNDADKKRMKKVAKNGGGKHFHAVNKSDLKNVFRDIAKSLPTLLTQ